MVLDIPSVSKDTSLESAFLRDTKEEAFSTPMNEVNAMIRTMSQ